MAKEEFLFQFVLTIVYELKEDYNPSKKSDKSILTQSIRSSEDFFKKV